MSKIRTPWDFHVKRLARVLRGVTGIPDPQREIVEAILHLGEEMAKISLGSEPAECIVCGHTERKKRRFEVGDEVVTKCDGAVPNSSRFKKRAKGTVIDPSAIGTVNGCCIRVKMWDGLAWLVREDQLELVPKEEKQKSGRSTLHGSSMLPWA